MDDESIVFCAVLLATVNFGLELAAVTLCSHKVSQLGAPSWDRETLFYLWI